MPRRRKQRLPQHAVTAHIERLSAEGRGIAHIDGKVTFIDFCLPGEDVHFKYTKMSSKFDQGYALDVLQASPHRVTPVCPHFGVCGGCSLQHMSQQAQLEMKQQALLAQLQQLAKVVPETILEPLSGPVVGYRHKARLGVKYVAKKHKVLVGFREKGSSFIADLQSCKVLHASVGERLLQLAELIMDLDARQSIAQIEVAVSEHKTALVFRHLEDLSLSDQQKLLRFGQHQGLYIFLQPGGLDSVHPLWPENPEPLFYQLEQHAVRIAFEPTAFTQVNPQINQKMVNRALQLLDLNQHDQVLDLFCGLGNFTLPMARKAGRVTGVEGAQALVAKARHNARLNDIDNVTFHTADLSADVSGQPWLQQSYNKILLDPPRSGAMALLTYVGKMGAERIVYVSCHPATLARDAQQLTQVLGYTLTAAGVMDMFPHTAHIESIAVFEK